MSKLVVNDGLSKKVINKTIFFFNSNLWGHGELTDGSSGSTNETFLVI